MSSSENPAEFDVVVVGAGFAGLYMLHRLRELGLSTLVIEAGADVGGTWFWNRYPGARCDAESALYSYSFSDELQQEWSWSEKYATQPELLTYLRHVADRFGLRDSIRFDTRVTEARYDPASASWAISTDTGDRLIATYCIMATGCLSVGRLPEIDGLLDSDLEVFHTGNWPTEPVDFRGKRVGIIGTGSSGIQLIPEVAAQAAELVVFQRSASYSVPARNAPVDQATEIEIKSNYGAVRQAWRIGELVGGGETIRPGNRYRRTQLAMDSNPEERRDEYENRWQRGGAGFLGAYADLLVNAEANETAQAFIRSKIHDIVVDPTTADVLSPRGFPVGTKRICVDTDYYATYNRPNVRLVDLRADPIVTISDAAVITRDHTFELDTLICATGFDAMTGALLKIDIRGEGDIRLVDKWAEGPTAYLGVAISGFPNLFTITGPGSPSVLGNVVNHIEQHVEFISDLIADSLSLDTPVIEADAAEESAWAEHVTELASHTLYPAANSWYMGANVPGKPRVFMPFVGGIAAYRAHCEEVVATGYRGFRRTPAPLR